MSGNKITKQFRGDINKLKDKYTPTNGCENCWGDLHQGCTEKCRNEFKTASEFDNDIVDLITKVANGVNSEKANCAIFDVSISLPDDEAIKEMALKYRPQQDELGEFWRDGFRECYLWLSGMLKGNDR